MMEQFCPVGWKEGLVCLERMFRAMQDIQDIVNKMQINR